MIVFKIDGTEYPFTGRETMNLKEARILYHYSGLTLDQIDDVNSLHPGMISAFVHIAIRRKEPGRSAKDIEAMVDEVSLDDLVAAVNDAIEREEAKEGPPTNAPSSESETGNGSSGRNGNETGEPHPEPWIPAPTGIPPSPTGSAESNPRILAD